MSASSRSYSGSPSPPARRCAVDAHARAARVARLAQRVHVAASSAHVGLALGRRRGCGHVRPVLDADGQLAELRHAAAKVVPNCWRSHLRATAPAATVGAVSRADDARRRAGRAGRTCASRCSRRGRGGRCRAGCRSPCCAGRCCGSAGRSACRWSALVHARQDLDLVGLLALRDVAAGAGAAAVQLGLDVGLGQRHARAGSRRSRSRWPGRGSRRNW
jgi:hypothetical protein